MAQKVIGGPDWKWGFGCFEGEDELYIFAESSGLNTAFLYLFGLLRWADKGKGISVVKAKDAIRLHEDILREEPKNRVSLFCRRALSVVLEQHERGVTDYVIPSIDTTTGEVVGWA